MALVNVETREIHCKIVYYGPGFCGKTSNLTYLHETAPAVAKGELLSVATETERTLFFDFLPLNVGVVDGYNVRFHLYTVPGQPLHEHTRVAMLTGVDGIVFVADSQPSRFQATLQSYEELSWILAARGKSLDTVPLVLQYNKRDVPDPVPVAILNARLNRIGAPFFEAIASEGVGVLPTLRAITERVVGVS